MSKLKCACRTALYDVRIMVMSAPFVMLSVVALVFMDVSLRPLRLFAADFHQAVVPAELPFYLADISYGNIVLLLLVLLFSDIPLKNGAQKFLLQRGKSLAGSGAGHVLGLFLAAAAFAAELALFSVALLLPDVTFGDWGKVWGSFASGQAGQSGYMIGFATSYEVMRMYAPWQAVGASLLLFFLTGCLYAVAEYILNGLSGGKAGTVALSAWSVAWLFLANVPFSGARKLMAYSPQSWLDLSRFGPEGVFRRVGILAVAVLALSAVAVFLVKRRKIELVK